jgi:hypothetical protein
MMIFGPYPEASPNFSRGKGMLFEGDWHTAIMRNIYGGYLAQSSYFIELAGVGKNTDCHLINAFLDALYLRDEDSGAILIRDCDDVHLRNSLMRVNAQPGMGLAEVSSMAGSIAGACVAMRSTQGYTRVAIEGCSLECPGSGHYRVLDVGPGTNCFFYHSTTDSVVGRDRVVQGGLPPESQVVGLHPARIGSSAAGG